MTEVDRARLRALQDAWLKLPHVLDWEKRYGDRVHIVTPDSPTIRDVRTTLLPEWEAWFLFHFKGPQP
jgi:hypothetical protein